MGTYVYGAKGNEAGARAILSTPAKAGRSGQLGTTCHVGAFERGPVGEIRFPGSLDMARRIFGRVIEETQANLAMEDLFAKARGSAKFYGVRVSDGNDAAAYTHLFNRDVDTSYGNGALSAFREAAKLPGPVAKVSAWNGGRWGGQANTYGGKVVSVSGAISGASFDTGLTGSDWPFVDDELKGAVFTLQGETREWTVDGNDDAGVIEVSGDFTGVTATDGRWRVVLANQRSYDLTNRSLALVVRDAVADPNDYFDIRLFEDRDTDRGLLSKLEMSTTGEYFETLINEALEASQWEIETVDLFTGDVTLEQSKPANFAEIALPDGVGTNTVKFRIMNYQNTGTGTGAAHTLTDGGSMVPHKYVLTVKSGATTFTVAAYDVSGTRLLASDLDDGTIGSAYAAPHPFLSGFTLSNGSAAYIEGDIITVYVRPLPTNLNKLGGWFYPYAFASTGTGGNDVTEKYRIYSNTYDTITLGPSDDISDVVVEPGPAYQVGTVNWNSTLDITGKTFKYKRNGGAETTVTATVGAVTVEAAVIDLNAQVALGSADIEFYTSTDSSGNKHLAVRGKDGYYGPAYSLQITTGTINVVAGFTDDATAAGVTPTVGRLEFKQELNAGRDGLTGLAASHYSEMWDAETSPIMDLMYEDVGLVKFAMPGITDATAQQSMMDFAEAFGGKARVEIPSNVLTEPAMQKWLKDNITPNDFFSVAWPSYGYRSTHPFGGSVRYLSTMTGAIQGVEALYARNNEGYQKPATDPRALVSPIFTSLPTDRDNGEAVPLNNDLINGSGVQEMRHRGPSIYIWGARDPGENWIRSWKHKTECLLHITHEVLNNTTPLTFRIINGTAGKMTRMALISTIRSLMRPHFFALGGSWFIGDTFEDAVDIKVDDENNPADVQAIGKLVGALSVSIVDTNETTDIYIGEKGVSM